MATLSAGMIASVRELGIGEDHDGILVLSTLGLDPEIGTDALEVLSLHDEAAEINVTPDRATASPSAAWPANMPMRPERNSRIPRRGVAVAAADGQGYPVRLEDQAPIYGKPGCDRFVARTVRGVDPSRPTPPWMASRLRLAGIRSISLVVDISNYVMLELGQPLHFYDLDRLAGAIVVRRANQGETLETLDGKDRKLDPEDLLITDDSGAIGIAGVMGGAATEVSDSTVNVLVEAAHFEEVGIARSRRRHKLPSEASKRFERGVDWQVADEAAQRAVDLLIELAGGTADATATDAGQEPAAVVIDLPAHYAAERIGMEFTEDQIVSSLPGPGRRRGEVRRRLPRYGAELAHGSGHQGGPDRGDRAAGRLRQDSRHAARRSARTGPDAGPAAAPPRAAVAGGRRPDRGALLPVRDQGGTMTPSVRRTAPAAAR